MKVTVVPNWSAMATRRKTRTTTVTRTRTVVQGSFAFVSSSYLGGYLLLSAITIVSHLRTEAGGRWGGGWGWGVHVGSGTRTTVPTPLSARRLESDLPLRLRRRGIAGWRSGLG